MLSPLMSRKRALRSQPLAPEAHAVLKKPASCTQLEKTGRSHPIISGLFQTSCPSVRQHVEQTLCPRSGEDGPGAYPPQPRVPPVWPELQPTALPRKVRRDMGQPCGEHFVRQVFLVVSYKSIPGSS